jgi:LysM repeat protein
MVKNAALNLVVCKRPKLKDQSHTQKNQQFHIMNTEQNPSPLVPQGSIVEQKNKGRARVKIAVFFVLAIHGIGLMALLMQGCQKEKEPAVGSTEAAATNNETAAAAPTFEPTNTPVAPSNEVAAAAAAAANSLAANTAAESNANSAQATPTAGASTEYVVAKGDNFYSIAKKVHATVKSLKEANPKVDPTKLQIGQKLQVPAATVATASNPAPTVADTSDNSYTVKSGDTLSKIATHYGLTVRAIRSANSLKTDSIKVGQRLKIPVKAAAASATAASGGEAVPAGALAATNR